MGTAPEYIEDYLRIIKEELKDRYKLTEEEAAKAVYKSAVRSILTGSNEEMRRYQMHKSIEETALDIYRQYKNVGSRVSSRNGEEEVSKIMHADNGYTSMRRVHKEKVSVLQDIPLMMLSDDDDTEEETKDSQTGDEAEVKEENQSEAQDKYEEISEEEMEDNPEEISEESSEENPEEISEESEDDSEDNPEESKEEESSENADDTSGEEGEEESDSE